MIVSPKDNESNSKGGVLIQLNKVSGLRDMTTIHGKDSLKGRG